MVSTHHWGNGAFTDTPNSLIDREAAWRKNRSGWRFDLSTASAMALGRAGSVISVLTVDEPRRFFCPFSATREVLSNMEDGAYKGSRNIGWPRLAQCTRTWCLRPVRVATSNRRASGDNDDWFSFPNTLTTLYDERAGLPSTGTSMIPDEPNDNVRFFLPSHEPSSSPAKLPAARILLHPGTSAK